LKDFESNLGILQSVPQDGKVRVVAGIPQLQHDKGKCHEQPTIALLPTEPTCCPTFLITLQATESCSLLLWIAIQSPGHGGSYWLSMYQELVPKLQRDWESR
jgi:hypothetical protein